MSLPSDYPVQLDVDYPARPLNRLTTFFRLVTVIPILVIIALLGAADRVTGEVGSSAGLLFAPLLLMILFRQKYPRWWFDWIAQLMAFAMRVMAYLFLLRDEYPSTDDTQAVHLSIEYPDAERELNRFLPLVKWILALPHYIVLWVLGIAAFVAIVIAWFTILFTGRYPEGLFNFVVGFMRWSVRVQGYAFLLVTDRYPPFRLQP